MSGCASEPVDRPTPTVEVALGDLVTIEGGKQCHVGAAGMDASGNTVAVTSGHCAAEEATVSVAVNSAATPIGHVAYINYPLDFAVIKLDGSAEIADSGIAKAGAIDPQRPGCISLDTDATGDQCGTLLQPQAGSLYATGTYCSLPGDSGMPVVQQGTLVGINGGTVATAGQDENPCSFRTQTPHDAAYFYPIAAILESMTSHGSPGAGLTIPETSRPG